MGIAVLIPCFNEEQTIANVIDDFKTNLPEAKIYVYDNNSTDKTKEIAIASGAIVKSERQQGKGNVIRRMFREIDADCYIMVDGDATYPAKHAKEMVKSVMEDECDMVIGDRLSSTYFKENKRLFHNQGNRIVRWLINTLWNAQIHDIMTGYRAFSRRFVKLFPISYGGFEIETEMTLHALDKRFVIKEIPIDYSDRPDGSESKLNTYKDGLKVLKTIFILFKEYKPMPFFGGLALFLFCIGLIAFIPILIEFFQTGLVPRFPTLIVSMFLMIAALQSFFTGLCLSIICQNYKKQYELHVINHK